MRPSVEWGFSPEGSAEALDTRFVAAAKSQLRVMAYGLTYGAFVDRLIAAHARGVDVAVVVDFRENIAAIGYGGKPGIGIPELTRLVQGGVHVRTNALYPIHHDKVMVADGLHTRTGSCNFTGAAAHANSENVVVLWKHAPLAVAFLVHWQNRWDGGQDFVPPAAAPSIMTRLAALVKGRKQ